MKNIFSVLVLGLLSLAASGQETPQNDFTGYPEVCAAVSRMLTIPGYTQADEELLNRSGDLVAVAILKCAPPQEMTGANRARILSLLRMAFAEPQRIAASANRTPSVTRHLLDELERMSPGNWPDNDLRNTRIRVEQSVRTGKPAEIVSSNPEVKIDRGHTLWIGNVLDWALTVKPGMTRTELLQVFTGEGGLSTRAQQTYVLKTCPYIKVDVEFSIPAAESDKLSKMPGDKILRISKPYLEYSITD